METLIRDLRYSIRMLLRNKAFTIVAVLSIALGVGANTAVFSVVNSVLLKSLPFNAPDSLVLVWGDGQDSTRLVGRNQVSATDVADIRKQATVFEDIATYSGWYPIMSGDLEAERVPGIQVGDGFFKVMRGTPMLGRVFTPEEQEEGKDFVIVLGHALWQRRFGSDPNIVGKTVLMSGRSYTIVGVMGPDFRPLPESLVEPQGQFYRPVAEPYNDSARDERHLRAIARLKDGVTIAQAQNELKLITQRMQQQHPQTNKNQSVNVVSITDDTVGGMRQMLWVMFAAVVLVLLIACANVANLLLSRATGRHKEISVRAAIGASRGVLIRQLLTESVLLGIAGGALGLLIATWGTGLLATAAAQINPIFADITIDSRVLLFTFGISLVTGLIFGIAPAWRMSNPNLSESLKETGQSVGAGSSGKRLRSGLVVAEVALTLVLLVCAGLLIRTVLRLADVKTGFNTHNVLAMNIGLPSAKYPKPENVRAFYEQANARLAAIPGVKAAGVTSVLPLSDNFDGRGLAVEDFPKPRGEEMSVDMYVVSPGYLEALEIALQQGRTLNAFDNADSQQVALINRTMADQLWPNQSPLGKRIKLAGGDNNRPWKEVVGVVDDVTQYGLDKKPPMQIYIPHSQFPTSFNTLVVRTSGDPTALLAAVRNEIKAIDKDQAVFKVTTLDELHSQSMALRRFFMVLLILFAALALTLAVVGIYGVMAYAVSQRTREFGIRMALGAQGRDVLAIVARSGLGMTFIGIGIGLLSAVALTRFLSAILFEIKPTDLPTFAVVSLGLIAISGIACYIPARRATRVSPLVALRHE